MAQVYFKVDCDNGTFYKAQHNGYKKDTKR